jgi:hypothetical protein
VILAALALATVALPSPVNALSPTPPFGGPALTETEGGLVHRVQTTEHVTARVDAQGRVFAVGVHQRLVVFDQGDYVYYIPAPVIDVLAAPGSESMPGQRRNFILWSGFNPRRKVLAADARLRPVDAAKLLPIRIETDGDRIVVRNATRIGAGTFTADAVAPPLARYLDSVRAAVSDGRPVPQGTAVVRGRVAPASAAVEAPLHVTGTIGGRHVNTTLGDGRPLSLVVLQGNGKIDLRIAVVPPTRLLTPPNGAAAWAASRASGRTLLARANAVLLRLARARQFDSFLADPDPRGGAQTTYVYRTGQPSSLGAERPIATATDAGRSAIWNAATIIGVVAFVGAGLVVWARS